MSEPKDGGAAFPEFERVDEYNPNTGTWSPRDIPRRGMSLRDYFAAQALNGYLSSSWSEARDNPRNAAAWSYEQADAMLAARMQKPEAA